MNEIEIRTKRGSAATPTTRRVFLNGSELPGVRDIHIVNRAGEAIDFCEVSVTFLVHEANLKVIDEAASRNQEALVEQIQQGVLDGFTGASDSQMSRDASESRSQLNRVSKIRVFAGNICGSLGKWFLKIRKRLLQRSIKQ